MLLIQASAGDYDPVDHAPGYSNEFLKFLYPNTEVLVCAGFPGVIVSTVCLTCSSKDKVCVCSVFVCTTGQCACINVI